MIHALRVIRGGSGRGEKFVNSWGGGRKNPDSFDVSIPPEHFEWKVDSSDSEIDVSCIFASKTEYS